MKLGFHARPDDLFVVAALAVLLSGVALLGVGGVAGLAMSVVLVLFLPGYALVAVLFPATGQINWLQRTTLSIVLSLAIVPLAGLFANYTPWGIRLGPVLGILDAVAVGGCAVAYVRRQRLPRERRLRLAFEIRPVRWRGLSSLERTLAVALGIALIVASASLAYSATVPSPAPGFTEFYLLNETGMPRDYPTNLTAGQVASVIVVVANHESKSMDYTIEIVNTTLNGPVEVSNFTVATLSLRVDDLAQNRTVFSFRIDQSGEYRFKFLLYVGAIGPAPYRASWLRITVI